MSRPNVEQSLDAVEKALSHFSASLDRAGFRTGADAYRQMADIVLGQWLWIESAGERDLEPRYLRIAALSESVADQLTPYLDTMRRLTALRGLVEERWGVHPDSAAGRIVGVLASLRQPMSTSQMAAATGDTGTVLRRALTDLVRTGQVRRIGDRRPKYVLNGWP